MAFLDALAVYTLRVGQAKQTLLEEIAGKYVSIEAGEQERGKVKPTLSRSRKQKRCSGGHGCQTHQQYHLHPIGKHACATCRVKSLSKGQSQLHN